VAYRAVRANGGTVRKLLDCLIAAVALRTGATVVHRDRGFDVLAAALPDLRVRSLL
jgi:predicted nucleic acid-binding protein